MLKTLKILVLTLLVLFYLPQNVSAHLPGQNPFFKVNSIYASLYPVPSTSMPNFPLPQDLAPQPYLINQPIEFELDTTKLPILPELLEKIKFSWDMGDGTKLEGLKNTYTYKKPGSYYTTIYAAYGTEEPQLIQSTLIHILPDSSYQLPKAIIKVNNQTPSDPLVDIVEHDFSKPVQLDASTSTANSSQIVSYYWDFGDQNSTNDKSPTHKYIPEIGQVFPVLRVVDANGFVNDSYVQISNTNYKNPFPPQTNPKDYLGLIILIGGIIIIVVFIYKIFKK